jgi:hypothetical protein
MIVILVISICLNIISGFAIVFLFKQLKQDKKQITVLSNNNVELKKYYDQHTSQIIDHLKTEQEVKNATDEEAKKTIADIVSHNNAVADGVSDNKSDKK